MPLYVQTQALYHSREVMLTNCAPRGQSSRARAYATRWRLCLLIPAGTALLIGCTTYDKARTAFGQGRYEEAAAHFEEVLAETPDRLHALVGLGVSRYKLGAYDRAVTTLSRAVTQAPKSETAQLYLGLSYLRTGQDGPAQEHLTRFTELKPNVRLQREVERALTLLRTPSLSPEVRAFVADSLDDGAEWAREARQRAQSISPWPAVWVPGPCVVTRSGRLFCY